MFVIACIVLGYNIYKFTSQKRIYTNLEALGQDSWAVIASSAVEKYVGKPIRLPYIDSLHVTEVQYQGMCRLPFKIVNFLDGNCTTCLLKINYWKEFTNEMNSQGCSIPIVIYAYSSLEEDMRVYLNRECTSINFYWQFDKDKSFISENELYDLRLQTVLLDAYNNVILIGDPLLNPTLRELYMDTIKSLL